MVKKNSKSGRRKGLKPKEYLDDMVDSIKELWKLMNISYDKFIRTTDDYHVKAVQKIFKSYMIREIYIKGEYEGWYCTPCESFWRESQLENHNCPDCGRPVEKTKEEAYFF